MSIDRNIIVEVLEIPNHVDLAAKFKLDQLEQVLQFQQSQRSILLERKDSSVDGYEIEQINNELAGIRLETTKLNKAIAILKVKKKPIQIKQEKMATVQKTISVNLPVVPEPLVSIVPIIQAARKVTELTEDFELDILKDALVYIRECREVMVNALNQNKEPSLTEIYQGKLREINNQIDRTRRAINQIEVANRPKKTKKAVPLKKTYAYLNTFNQIAVELLQAQYPDLLDEIQQTAKIKAKEILDETLDEVVEGE
ncbi:hypothetical protein [Acinetobacter sp. P1(2025)]|uniref:hypothetical protein n=1 Tax=Acinetobacter sp. P1(2025) TaxID=3446120 RepID=UPI003F531F19